MPSKQVSILAAESILFPGDRNFLSKGPRPAEDEYLFQLASATRCPDQINALVMDRGTFSAANVHVGSFIYILVRCHGQVQKDGTFYSDSQRPGATGWRRDQPDSVTTPDYVFNYLDEALSFLDTLEKVDRVFILGNETVFAQALEDPFVTRTYIGRSFPRDFFPSPLEHVWIPVVPVLGLDGPVPAELIPLAYHVWERRQDPNPYLSIRISSSLTSRHDFSYCLTC